MYEDISSMNKNSKKNGREILFRFLVNNFY